MTNHWKKEQAGTTSGKVLDLIIEKPRSFTELLSKLKGKGVLKSPATLTNHLRRLETRGDIRLVTDIGSHKQVYEIVPEKQEKILAMREISKMINVLEDVLNNEEPVFSEIATKSENFIAGTMISFPGADRGKLIKEVLEATPKINNETNSIFWKNGKLEKGKTTAMIMIWRGGPET